MAGEARPTRQIWVFAVLPTLALCAAVWFQPVRRSPEQECLSTCVSTKARLFWLGAESANRTAGAVRVSQSSEDVPAARAKLAEVEEALAKAERAVARAPVDAKVGFQAQRDYLLKERDKASRGIVIASEAPALAARMNAEAQVRAERMNAEAHARTQALMADAWWVAEELCAPLCINIADTL